LIFAEPLVSSPAVCKRMNDFQLWLDQWVWVENTQVRRRSCIPDFADALTEFMKLNGYSMTSEWRYGHMVVAKWMYRIHSNECDKYKYHKSLDYPEPFHRNWQEDYDEFQHILDTNTVSNFMENWKLYEDFDPETRLGQQIINELQLLLYPYIDMDRSKNGIRVAEAMEDSDSDSENWNRSNKVDVYLYEAREGMHGGYGYKV